MKIMVNSDKDHLETMPLRVMFYVKYKIVLHEI